MHGFCLQQLALLASAAAAAWPPLDSPAALEQHVAAALQIPSCFIMVELQTLGGS